MRQVLIGLSTIFVMFGTVAEVAEAQYDRGRIKGSVDLRFGGRRSYCGGVAPAEAYAAPSFTSPQLVCPPTVERAPAVLEYTPTIREPRYAEVSRPVDPCMTLIELAKIACSTDKISDEQRYQTHLLYEMLSQSQRQVDLQLVAATRIDRDRERDTGQLDPATMLLLQRLQERCGGPQAPAPSQLPAAAPSPSPVLVPVVPAVPYVPAQPQGRERDYGPGPSGYPQGPAPTPMSSQGHRSWPQVQPQNIRRGT